MGGNRYSHRHETLRVDRQWLTDCVYCLLVKLIKITIISTKDIIIVIKNLVTRVHVCMPEDYLQSGSMQHRLCNA